MRVSKYALGRFSPNSTDWEPNINSKMNQHATRLLAQCYHGKMNTPGKKAEAHAEARDGATIA